MRNGVMAAPGDVYMPEFGWFRVTFTVGIGKAASVEELERLSKALRGC